MDKVQKYTSINSFKLVPKQVCPTPMQQIHNTAEELKVCAKCDHLLIKIVYGIVPESTNIFQCPICIYLHKPSAQ